MDVQLPHSTLSLKSPPGFNGIAHEIRRAEGLSDDQAQMKVRKVQSLWYIIQRGLKAVTIEKELGEKRRFFTENADLSPTEAFGLRKPKILGWDFLP